METYVATATREGKWWVIIIETPKREVATQAKSLERAAEVAREAVAMALDVPEDSFNIEVRPVLDKRIRVAVDQVAALGAQLAEIQRHYATTIRDVAASLNRQGFTVRDAGVLMGVSPQRVSQLLAPDSSASVGHEPANPRPQVRAEVALAKPLKVKVPKAGIRKVKAAGQISA